MRPAVVADIGNSRIKWGRCGEPGLVEAAALPPDDPAAWDRQLRAWHLDGPLTWAVAGVAPARMDRLLAWLRQRADTVAVVGKADQLPLAVRVPEPDKVGIDRLLDAVAVNARRRPGEPAIVVDAGTAITINAIDASGTFLGGAILPGPRLMALALHEHTALLPLVERISPEPAAPATATRPAIELGIHAAIVGGVNRLIRTMGGALTPEPENLEVFVTGGAAEVLRHQLIGRERHDPHLTLEGLRLTAEALP